MMKIQDKKTLLYNAELLNYYIQFLRAFETEWHQNVFLNVKLISSLSQLRMNFQCNCIHSFNHIPLSKLDILLY